MSPLQLAGRVRGEHRRNALRFELRHTRCPGRGRPSLATTAKRTALLKRSSCNAVMSVHQWNLSGGEFCICVAASPG